MKITDDQAVSLDGNDISSTVSGPHGLNRPPASGAGRNIGKFAMFLTNLDIRAHHVTGVAGTILLASSAITGSMAVVENSNTFAIASTVVMLAGLLCFTALISGHIESLSYNLRTAKHYKKHDDNRKEPSPDEWQKGGENNELKYRPEVLDVLRSSGFGVYCLVMGMGAAAVLHYGIMAAGLSAMEMGVSSFFMGFAMGTLMGTLASLYIAHNLNQKTWVNAIADARPGREGVKHIDYKWNGSAYINTVANNGQAKPLLPEGEKSYKECFINSAAFTGGIMTGLVMGASTVLVSALTPAMEAALGAGTLVNCLSFLIITVPAVVVCPVAHRVVDDIIHAGHELEIELKLNRA